MKKLLAFVVLASLVAACAQPMYQVSNHPLPLTAQNLSMDQIERAILFAGQNRGWRMERLAPGKLRAVQVQPKFSATVDIVYDQKGYSIQPVETAGLRERDGKVHPHYNIWVRNLENDIQSSLSNLSILGHV
jgi:hypothetical protein